MSSLKVAPVIMSGGSGTRLWPLSTDKKPKQFHALASELSMIQDTALRFHGDQIAFLPPIVICNHRHGELARAQLVDLGIEPAAVILEPFGRNTASVAIVAAAWTLAHAPGALTLLLPADHVITDPDGFRSAIGKAVTAAGSEIVTFGIEPNGPETGYGYIQRGAALHEGVYRVARFVEKPNRKTAEGYLAEGGYAWNAGIFLYSPAVMLAEAQRLCPDIATAAVAASRKSRPRRAVHHPRQGRLQRMSLRSHRRGGDGEDRSRGHGALRYRLGRRGLLERNLATERAGRRRQLRQGRRPCAWRRNAP